MKVITGSGPHTILPAALDYLFTDGIPRDSRNGRVLQAPTEVTTVYLNPRERVVFWPERDANPFFHVYEALWMLAGRNDVAGPSKYVKTFAQFSDDGKTFHGAYGYRWRRHFEEKYDSMVSGDQLPLIAQELRQNPDSRRCVLQMWDFNHDLGKDGKDLPCNLTVTFQVDPHSKNLNMVVFNRSNDAIWGCYGANAVHFSYLHEYMSVATGIPMGRYSQVSVNLHVYDNDLFKRVAPIRHSRNSDPYWGIVPVVMPQSLSLLDDTIQCILEAADSCQGWDSIPTSTFSDTMQKVLFAHQIYRESGASAARDHLSPNSHIDWIVAARQWLDRRVEGGK